MSQYEVEIMSHAEQNLLQMAIISGFLILAHMLTAQICERWDVPSVPY